jgi:endo-1,4-beta-D-glucanase Y
LLFATERQGNTAGHVPACLDKQEMFHKIWNRVKGNLTVEEFKKFSSWMLKKILPDSLQRISEI